MGNHIRTFGKALLKGLIWIFLCCIPTALFCCFFDTSNIATIIVSCAFALNPLYLSIINYRFISKKNAFFIWLFLVLLQTPWYFSLIFRENGEWMAIRILISYIGNYQIIGITICFAVTCLAKGIIYLIKKKKALKDVSTTEEGAGENNGNPF